VSFNHGALVRSDFPIFAAVFLSVLAESKLAFSLRVSRCAKISFSLSQSSLRQDVPARLVVRG
jgi:hypothetical protein